MSVRKTWRSLIKWPLLNPDTGLLPVNAVSWRAIETAPGVYDFSAVEKALENGKNIKRYVLLRILPEKPEWCKNGLQEYTALVDALAEKYGDHPLIWGVDIFCPGEKAACCPDAVAALAKAYCRGFKNAYKFAEAGSLFEKALAGEKMGLIVNAENLQEHAKKACQLPLRMAVDPKNQDQIDEAVKAGVYILEAKDPAGANLASHAGHRFQLRSIEIDDGDVAENIMAATVELANGGITPSYTHARFYLRLSGSDVPDLREYPLDVCAADLAPGEVKFIRLEADLSGLTPGEYEVQVGLFCEESGYPVSFGIDGRISDGYYEGRLILKTD